MSEKFKIGDKVRAVQLVSYDHGRGLNIGDTGIVKAIKSRGELPCETLNGVLVDFGKHINCTANRMRDGGYIMWDSQLELVSFKLPASPFYIRHRASGNRYKVEISGDDATLTSLNAGERLAGFYTSRNAHDWVRDGIWQLIDPPPPAVDPVTYTTTEYQRLLREYDEAGKVCGELASKLDAAEKTRREIGKALKASRRALEQANHDAAGVEFNEPA